MDVEKALKRIGAVVAFGGLALGVANYLATAKREAETRNLDARKQYLTRQLDLYTEATRAAAKLATALAGRIVGRPRLALLTSPQPRSIGSDGSLAHSESEAS